MKKFLSFRTSASRLAWIFAILQAALIPFHFFVPCDVSVMILCAGVLLMLGVWVAYFFDKTGEAPVFITLAVLLLHIMFTH